MPKDTTPQFSLKNINGNIQITETKSGFIGRVTKNESGYAVHLLSGPTDDKLKANTIKRMRNWYVYTQVKK